jgi:hypothetical protein
MSTDVDLSQSPLFNPNFIGGWAPLAGIKAHWTVQGIVNLLASPECGFTLISALIFTLLCWKKLDRLQIALIISAALFFGALTYGFAVDPRGRMFMPIIVVAATLIGGLSSKLWVWPRMLVVLTFFSLIAIVGTVKAATRVDYRPDAEKADKLLAADPYLVTTNARQRLALIRQDYPAGGSDLIEIDDRCPPRQRSRWLALRDENLCIYGGPDYAKNNQRIQMIISPVPGWIADRSGQIETDPDTRQYLGALRSARDLPGLGSGRPYLLLYGTNSCQAWLARNGLRHHEFSLVDEQIVSRTPFLGNEWSGSVCLFKYRKQVPAAEVQAAILRARADKLYMTEPRTAFDLQSSIDAPLLHIGQARICGL